MAATALGVIVIPQSGAGVGSPGYYAYVTASELVVMKRASVVARVPVKYDFSLSDLVATQDGRFFALVAKTFDAVGENSNDRMLVAVDAMSGKVRTFGCPSCQGAAAIGGSSVVVSSEYGDGSILRFDLADGRPPIRYSASLQEGAMRIVAGAKDHVFAVQDIGRETESYFSIGPQGDMKKLGTKVASRDSLGRALGASAAVGLLSNGEARLAVSAGFAPSRNRCAIDAGVTVFSTDGRGVIETDLSGVLSSGAKIGTDGGLVAVDLWWEREDELHAVFAEGRCATGRRISAYSSYAEWRLRDGERWARVSDEEVYSIRNLGRTSRILLMPPGGVDAEGSLFLEEGGVRSKIADAVVAIEAPLAEYS